MRVPLQISRALCLYVAPSSLIICFINFSCLGLPKLWTLSSQLTKACLCLDSPSLHSLFSASELGHLIGSTCLFFFFQGLLFYTDCYPVFENLFTNSIFIYFVQCLVFKTEQQILFLLFHTRSKQKFLPLDFVLLVSCYLVSSLMLLKI